MASLKDQLLKAGVGNQKQARQADHARRQAAKGRVEGETPAELAQKAKAEQLQRDREANLKRQQLQAEKALQAQIKQMIEDHRIERAQGQIAYQYTADKKVKKLIKNLFNTIFYTLLDLLHASIHKGLQKYLRHLVLKNNLRQFHMPAYAP